MPDVAVLRRSIGVVFANHRLRRIALTYGLFIAGEAAFLVLLSVTAFDRAGTTAVAVVGVVRMVPGAIAAPTVSLVADRMSRVHVLIAVLLSWTALLCVVPAALTSHSLLPLYVVVGAASVTGTLLRPAVNALIPQLVDRPEELAAANSAYSFVEAAGTLIGPLLAGLLVSSTSSTTRYVVTAFVFAAGALFCLGLRTDFKPPERLPGARWRRIVEPLMGFPALVGRPGLRVVFGVTMAQTATRGAVNVLVVSAAVSLLHSGLSSTGPLFAAIGAGGLLGAVGTMLGAGLRPALPFVLGMTLWGLPLLLIAAHPTLVVSWVALAVIGVGNAFGDVYGLTLLHRLVPDHLLGRAFGAFWGTASAALALGSLAASALIHHVGTRQATLIVGLVMTAIPLLSWFSVRQVDTDLDVDPHRIEALRRCTLLAPLTRVAIEQLARRSRPITVPAGTAVVKQGEVTDTFYVIDTGEFDTTIDEQRVRTLSGGDCFGEIAALDHTPRTATVTARTDANVLAVTGMDFVLAVTGHIAAERTARELVTQRVGTLPADRTDSEA